MTPTLEQCIRNRQKRLALIPIAAMVLGALTLIPGALSLALGRFSVALVIGPVLIVGGAVFFIRSRSITSDPVHKVLSNPASIRSFRVVRTNLQAAGNTVQTVDSVEITHAGGTVMLPVRGVSMEAVLGDVRALAPQATQG